MVYIKAGHVNTTRIDVQRVILLRKEDLQEIPHAFGCHLRRLRSRGRVLTRKPSLYVGQVRTHTARYYFPRPSEPSKGIEHTGHNLIVTEADLVGLIHIQYVRISVEREGIRDDRVSSFLGNAWPLFGQRRKWRLHRGRPRGTRRDLLQ
ncbi:hypothetical protein PMIN07_009109 [Paraphaeosphaeria minitans]